MRLAQTGADFELHNCTRSRERTAFAGRIAAPVFADRVHCHLDAGASAQKRDLPQCFSAPRNGEHVSVCRPKGFMDAVLGTARAASWPESKRHFAFFGAEAAPAAGDTAFEEQLASSGRVVPVAAGQTMVQALADVGIEVMTSCGQGVCGTCLIRVLAGQPEHRGLYLAPEEQAANDQFLPCCSRATSARRVLDI